MDYHLASQFVLQLLVMKLYLTWRQVYKIILQKRWVPQDCLTNKTLKSESEYEKFNTVRINTVNTDDFEKAVNKIEKINKVIK